MHRHLFITCFDLGKGCVLAGGNHGPFNGYVKV